MAAGKEQECSCKLTGDSLSTEMPPGRVHGAVPLDVAQRTPHVAAGLDTTAHTQLQDGLYGGGRGGHSMGVRHTVQPALTPPPTPSCRMVYNYVSGVCVGGGACGVGMGIKGWGMPTQ